MLLSLFHKSDWKPIWPYSYALQGQSQLIKWSFNVLCLFENAALKINSQKRLFVDDHSKLLLWPGSRWLPWASSHHSLQESKNQIKWQNISFYLLNNFMHNMCSVLMEVWFKDQLVVIRFYSLVTVLNPILGTWQIEAVLLIPHYIMQLFWFFLENICAVFQPV